MATRRSDLDSNICVTIVGPGALGSVIGAALSESGTGVTLLGRPSAHLAAIRDQGLVLRAADGTERAVLLRVSDDPRAVADSDVVIVLVKAGDTAAAMQAISPWLRPNGVVLTLQNGLGNADTIRSVLGSTPLVLQGVTSLGAMREFPGVVAHTGAGPSVIGYTSEREMAAADRIARTFSAAGLPAAIVPDIEREVWRKLAVNAAVNGLTALGGFCNGRIAEDAELLDAAEIIADEVAAVARARGIELGGMRRTLLETTLATAPNRSSMLQDVEAGRPTEVDAIHGAILTAGRAAGILTPATKVLDALIREKTRTLEKEHADDE